MNLELFVERYKNEWPDAAIAVGTPMCKLTSFRTGGPADVLVSPSSGEQLVYAFALCRELELPYTVLGICTNVLVKDGGIRGVVIYTGKMNAIRFVPGGASADAGARLMVLSRDSIARGLKGLAFASGIPGSIGGAVYMNAGAYGGETKDVVRSVRYVDTDTLAVSERSVTEADFGYRSSVFQGMNCVILSAEFALSPCADNSERELADEYLRRRREKQPVHMPSAGSVFKRPAGHFAGALIEKAGLKGVSVGGARVSPMHAGFIVNTGGASSADVIKLIERVKTAVYADSGVNLECEVRIIGEDD